MIPVLGKSRQEKLWGSWASQSTIISKESQVRVSDHLKTQHGGW